MSLEANCWRVGSYRVTIGAGWAETATVRIHTQLVSSVEASRAGDRFVASWRTVVAFWALCRGVELVHGCINIQHSVVSRGHLDGIDERASRKELLHRASRDV